MNSLSEKLPTLDEVVLEKRRRAEAKLSKVSAADISGWFTEVLGVKRLYPKQLAMIEAVRDYEQASVCGANSSGKDFTAARIALWWMAYHRDQAAKVVITAPTHRQIGDIVWQELRQAYQNANADLGGSLYQTPLLRWKEDRFIIGFSTDKPYQLQGFHSPNLLIIMSEAHGMEQAHVDALWRLNPNRVLLTGNPISESGEFYDSHHAKAHLWHTINIDAWDTPNVIEGREVVPGLVTLADIERGRRNWGEDSPLYAITYKNEWVEGMGSLVVVPLRWALKAEQAEYDAGQIEVVACDVARYGTDRTVIWSRKGRKARILWRIQGADTMATTGVLKAYHDAHKYAHIVVDGTGVGAGVVDRLREQGVGVIEFQGGGAASESDGYVNRIAECWWRMRNGYEAGLDLPEDANLRSQVSTRRYEIQSDKRIKLESKDDMRKAGRHSPDEADGLAMTFVLDWQIGGSHLTAGSDVPEAEEQPESFGEQLGQSAVLVRGTEHSPFHASRWGTIRKGHRR